MQHRFHDHYRGVAIHLVLLCAVSAILGFVAGHALGARLTEGMLRAAIEAVGTQVLRSNNGPVILAMSIQAATAVLCAAIVPAITTLVVHRRIQEQEAGYELEELARREAAGLQGMDCDGHGAGRLSIAAGHTHAGGAPAGGAVHGVCVRVADGHKEAGRGHDQQTVGGDIEDEYHNAA